MGNKVIDAVDQLDRLIKEKTKEELVTILPLGTIGNKYCCPAAKYLKKKLNANVWVTATHVGIRSSYFPLPLNITNFVKAFDALEYEELVDLRDSAIHYVPTSESVFWDGANAVSSQAIRKIILKNKQLKEENKK